MNESAGYARILLLVYDGRSGPRAASELKYWVNLPIIKVAWLKSARWRRAGIAWSGRLVVGTFGVQDAAVREISDGAFLQV